MAEWTWLDYLGLTEKQASYALRQSRRAEDDSKVQGATITAVVRGVAIVERVGWDGQRLLDYPVALP